MISRAIQILNSTMRKIEKKTGEEIHDMARSLFFIEARCNIRSFVFSEDSLISFKDSPNCGVGQKVEHSVAGARRKWDGGWAKTEKD